MLDVANVAPGGKKMTSIPDRNEYPRPKRALFSRYLRSYELCEHLGGLFLKTGKFGDALPTRPSCTGLVSFPSRLD